MQILIVDDDKDMVSLLRFIFQDEGYEVDAAYSGDEAIKKLNQNHYSVLILDYDLKDKTGFDVIKYMKENNMKSNILMLSGFSRSEVRNRAFELGVKEFLPKPFEIKDIMVQVDRLSHTKNGHSYVS